MRALPLNLQIILNTKKNTYLNQATPQKRTKISHQKKFRDRKETFDYPSHLKTGVLPMGI